MLITGFLFSPAVHDPLQNILTASDVFLRKNDVLNALKIIDDYVSKVASIPQNNKLKIKSQLYKILSRSKTKSARSNCHVTLSKLFEKLSNISGAIKELETAGKIDPQNGYIPLQLGRIHEDRLADHEKAMSYLKKTMDIYRSKRTPENKRNAEEAAKRYAKILELLNDKLRDLNSAKK